MTRDIKSVSFSKQDEYEAELLEFALSHSKYFGRYVKRLIADHRARVNVGDSDLRVVSPTKDHRADKKNPDKPYNRRRETKHQKNEGSLSRPEEDITNNVNINDFI